MDRITRIEIKNARSIEHLVLDLSDPTTLVIGANGSGKSTVVECLELLRKAGSQRYFLKEFNEVHGGLPALLRAGATTLELAAHIQDEKDPRSTLEYGFTLQAAGNNGVGIAAERLRLCTERNGLRSYRPILNRTQNTCHVFNTTTEPAATGPSKLEIGPGGLALEWKPHFGNEIYHRRVARALAGIEVHLPFATTASWAMHTYNLVEPIRRYQTLQPARRLALLGVNLADAWHELINGPEERRNQAIALVREALGEHWSKPVVESVPGGGHVVLGLRSHEGHTVYIQQLSDGQILWLGFIALALLNEDRSLLVFDEPDLHLHPSLIGKALSLFECAPAPVILMSHNDRVIDMLDDPPAQLRVLDLDDRGRTTLHTVDPEALKRWRAEFESVGAIHSADLLGDILAKAE